MSRLKTMMLAFAVVATPMFSIPTDATAGPLLDWLRGRHSCCFAKKETCCPPPATVAPNAYGLQPGQCATTCQKTCSRTVVNYVPQTCYRTNWNRVPVTQYKPVTTSDPCTGCTVTCMKPCTTYTYQMQRVPYTTYRPVYRTENYTVPVTTISNDCATGNCASGTCGTASPCSTCPTGTPSSAGCSTCGTNAFPQSPTPAGNFAPTQPNYQSPQPANGTYYEYPATNTPTGTISTQGEYNTSIEPADIAPSLQGISPQSSARPVLDQIRSGQIDYSTDNSRPANYPYITPTVPNIPEKTAQSPVRKDWNYTPVRLASYTSTSATSATPVSQRSVSLHQLKPIQTTQVTQVIPTIPTTQNKPLQLRGSFKPVQRITSQQNGLNGWVEVK